MNVVFSRLYNDESSQKVFFRIVEVLKEFWKEFNNTNAPLTVEVTRILYHKLYRELHPAQDFKSNFTIKKAIEVLIQGQPILIKEVYNERQRDNEIIVKTILP